jgi:choloylglycine hydrolase
MISLFKKIHLLLIPISFFSIPSFSCTTIFWNNNPHAKVVARSVDLFISDRPLIKTQPRGMEHTGETPKNSLRWKSKYGSVVVTAFHSYAVTDGMNEKGLAAHLLYLSGSEYPTNPQNKPEISNLMWSQYILDNFSTVNEALEGSKDLKIVPTMANNQTWPIHLAIEDASGDSAIVEFIKGKMHVYHGKEYRVMTNEPAYNIQLANLKRYQSFGGKLPLPGDPDPLSRFVRAATFLKTLPTPNDDLESIAGVLAVMRTAMVPFGALDTSGNKTEDAWATRWVSVADVTNKIYYFNSTSAPNIIWVDLNNINFTQGSPVLSIDPTNISLGGDITKQLKV